MKLMLTIESPGRPAGAQSHSIDRGDLIIGRGAAADWVLDDPQRLLSKEHCRIESRGGTFFLVDTSTNGVFVNAAETPLGRGNRVALQSGDRLTLGPYTIAATVTAEEVRVLPAAASALFPGPGPDWLDGSKGDSTPPLQEFFLPPTIEKAGGPSPVRIDDTPPPAAALDEGSDWLSAAPPPRWDALSPAAGGGGAIPDDWFVADEPPGAPPSPPAVRNGGGADTPAGAGEIPGGPQARAALDDIAAHVGALHRAIAEMLASLPPAQAAEARRVMDRAYHAARRDRLAGKGG